MKRIRAYISLLLALTVILSLTACGEENAAYTGTGFYFDTVINFCFYGNNAEEAIDKCLSLAKRYDNLWNKNKEESDIARINSSNCEPVEVSNETINLLETALLFDKASNGLVTPTVGALSSLWDFKSTDPSLPNSEELTESLKHIDSSLLVIEGNSVTLKDPYVKLDPGFIAKGYAADKMKELAVSLGVTSGWINLGGNVLAIGQKPDGSDFNIGIQNPSDTEGGAITAVSINDYSVVTSGVYERFFELDGIRYYHILDTKTGYPVRNNLLSVSVIGPSSAVCDGLSTTLFVLGIDEGNKVLEQFKDYKALYITDELSMIYSTDTE